MKAIVQDRYGSPDVFELRDIDRPVPRDDEVLIRVHAAGVGPDVTHMTTGTPYVIRMGSGLRRPRNPVPGWDGAGRVEAVGAKVTGLKPGDEVFGTCVGTFAEYARAKAGKVAPKPENLSFEQAAALPVSSITALQGLRDQAKVRPGQSILIIGASGGVGTYAVQLAKAFGLEVTGVCGPTGSDLVRSLGASDVIDYTRAEITDGGRRYDVILDTAGNRPLSLIRSALAPKGTFVIVGGETGDKPLLGMGRQFRASLLSPFVSQTLRGVFVAVTRQKDLLTLKELAEKEQLIPVIDSTYPLAEAPAAVRHVQEGHPRGKVVVTI